MNRSSSSESVWLRLGIVRFECDDRAARCFASYTRTTRTQTRSRAQANGGEQKQRARALLSSQAVQMRAHIRRKPRDSALLLLLNESGGGERQNVSANQSRNVLDEVANYKNIVTPHVCMHLAAAS